MQRSLIPIFGTAALTFLAYATFVQFAPFTVTQVQDQVATNMMRAQNFLATRPRTVLVGSSLTFRLPPPLLGPEVSNLGLVGGSPLTGLSLVEGSGERPALVLVEINLIGRPLDEDAVHDQLRFPEHFLRKYFRVFRTGYDPANLSWRALTHFTHQIDVEPVLSPQAAREFYLEQQRLKSRPPDAAAFHANLEQAGKLVAALQAKGIRVGFFEMPIDPGLTNSPADTAIRRNVAQAFPPGRYCWLHFTIPGGAHTVDGVHLTTGDAAVIARQILDEQRKCL
jgi:hypothetical protein